MLRLSTGIGFGEFACEVQFKRKTIIFGKQTDNKGISDYKFKQNMRPGGGKKRDFLFALSLFEGITDFIV